MPEQRASLRGNGKVRFAHETAENLLCQRVVYVCPECGWWKAQSFDCEHMVDAVDGGTAIRRYGTERCHFYLAGDLRRAKEEAHGE